ncbi:MAG: DUF512 domain-containing protein [Ruminococcaceae bacterium]|nr:DUF512 domain-containing protein [Oscillospiraceae bacterium]
MPIIKEVERNSIAAKKGISVGEELVAIDGYKINDVLDYKFYTTAEKITVTVRSMKGEERNIHIKKDEYDDIGLEFDTYLMDEQRHCKNKCIFCFIDQLPKGLRETLYFKDDDARLSFLLGNYITLTNITDEELERIIRIRVSPINVSVHTTNPELRVRVMSNPNASKINDQLKALADGGIKLNCQIVLMKGINDGQELAKTMNDLASLYPAVQSVSVVPVGLTKFRENLYPLVPFESEDSLAVIKQVEEFADKCLEKYGTRLFYASDEFYLNAKQPLPDYESYEDFPQIENGVGMLAMFLDEFNSNLDYIGPPKTQRTVSIATGRSPAEFLQERVDTLEKTWHNFKCKVYPITNNFFGERITVAGLVTATDIIDQLGGKDLGQALYIPKNMLCFDGETFLDDITVSELSQKLGVPVIPVECDGASFIEKLAEEI